MADMSQCENCRSTGLAILPTRYTVVPADLKPTLPNGISAKRVKDVALDAAHYQYALRTMRDGYLYLFYEKGTRGKNYWEVYSVGEDGSLYKQPDTNSAQPAEKTQSCQRIAHNRMRLHYLCIEAPEKCGKVYIAFSEFKWSIETVVAYEQDASARAQRMQLLDIAGWLKGSSDSDGHAAPADSASIKHILEYRADILNNPYGSHILHRAAYANDAKTPSTLGKHYKDGLEEVFSDFPFITRIDTNAPDESIEKTIASMRNSSKISDKQAYRPMLMGVWDAIGIARELNGFRNTAMGKVHQYQTEQGEWIDTYQSIANLEKTYQDLGLEKADQNRQDTDKSEGHVMSDKQIQEFREMARRQPQPRQGQLLELANDFQWLADQDLLTYYWQDEFDSADRFLREPERSKRLKELREQAIPKEIERKNNYWLKRQTVVKKDSVKAWTKCQEKLNLTVFTPYEKNILAFHEAAEKLTETRTEELLKWLKASLFLDTLHDYHKNQIADGILFNDMVGDVTFGIGSSKSGARQIEEWATVIAPSSPSNLLWRAMRLNDEAAKADIDKIVELGKQYKDKVHDEHNAKLIETSLKSLTKIADSYKKAQSFLDNAKKVKDKGYVKWTAATMLGSDKVITTAGFYVYRVFGIDKFGDYVGQRIIQHCFSLRAGVDPQASINLLKAQAAYQVKCNAQLVEFWQKTKGQIDIKKLPVSEQRRMLNNAWDQIKPEKKATALQDARLALIVGIFEYANILRCANSLTKGALDGKDVDWKTASSLAASALALTSVMFDVAATGIKTIYGMMGDEAIKAIGAPDTTKSVVKHLFKDMGDKTIAYQRMKFTGGMLGVMGSFIGFAWDATDAFKKSNNGQVRMAWLYGAKTIISGGSVLFSSFVALSYAPAFAQQFAKRIVAQQTAKMIERRIAAMIAWRLLGMGLGGLFTVITIVITVAIYLLDDTALQKWVDRSRFGTRHANEPFKSIKEENEELAKAIFEDA